MRTLPLITIACLCAACVPSADPRDAPVIIIDEEGGAGPMENPDDEEPPEDTPVACAPVSYRLAVPAGAEGLAAFIEPSGDVLVSWVAAGAGDTGEVMVGRARGPEWVHGPISLGTVTRAAETNFPAGVYATAVAANDDAVLVAWSDLGSTSIEGSQQDYARVMTRAVRADLTGSRRAEQASDDQYEGWAVNAERPMIIAEPDGFVVAWHDERLNEPRVYGQQAWLNGIYRTVVSNSGDVLVFDEQVQQSPSIWRHGRSLAAHPDGYAFFRGRAPHAPAVTGTTQESIVANPAALVGSAASLDADASGLLVWASYGQPRSFVSVGMPGDEATLVDDLDEYDTSAGNPRFVRGAAPPVVAWTRTEATGSSLRLAQIGDEVAVDEVSTALSGTPDEIHDAALVAGVRRVVVGIDGNVEIADVCPAVSTVAPRRRWVTASSPATLQVSNYTTDTDALNVSDSGTVLGAWVQLGDDELPGGEVHLAHGDRSGRAYAHGVVEGLDGMGAAGLWEVSVRGNGYGWRADGWSVRLLVE